MDAGPRVRETVVEAVGVGDGGGEYGTWVYWAVGGVHCGGGGGGWVGVGKTNLNFSCWGKGGGDRESKRAGGGELSPGVLQGGQTKHGHLII